MPYQSVADLPAAQVKGYSPKQKRAFLEAFNSAVYEQKLPEDRAFAIAHTAAKRAGGGGEKRLLRLRKKAQR
jgi:cation transport regulator